MALKDWRSHMDEKTRKAQLQNDVLRWMVRADEKQLEELVVWLSGINTDMPLTQWDHMKPTMRA
jgi:hypothetical protein